MKIKVYPPGIKVILHKTIARESVGDGAPVSARFKGTARKIDLTDWLSETSSVRTSKSVRDPAGSFSITLVDRPYIGPEGGAESLYGIIEPMDLIEIRMGHDRVQPQDPLPLIMRGFVSTVRRQRGMSQDGKPVRVVSVVGQDYGKLWQMLQILYLPGYIVGQDTISTFKLFERFGVGFKTVNPAGEFITEVIQKIVNPYLARMMPENTTNPAEIKLDISTTHGTVSVTGPQNREGTIYELLRSFTDVGVWNELYIEDRVVDGQDEGVFCVYRPNPFLKLDRSKIQNDAPNIETIDIPDVDVQNIDLGRSDANVANYYWVRGPRFEMSDDIWRRQYAVQNTDTVLLGKYPNSQDTLYGIRVMFVDSETGGDDVASFNSGQSKDDNAKRQIVQGNWLDDRRRILVEQNKDNVVLEDGMIRMRGNERVRAGVELKLKDGDFRATYYCARVDQEFSPFQGFFTTAHVERGTGFVDRAARGGGAQSPYWAELVR